MRIFRKFLFPFALLYGLVMLLRNFLYDTGFFKSTKFAFPVICVGNLSAGGTGKTPMIEYLLDLLSRKYKVAALSRGYGRETTGFVLLNGTEPAREVGDEPLQFKSRFKDAIIAVDENRVHGISLLKNRFSPEVVLLDDAFQHRKVKAGLNILLTSYGDLYMNDLMLPTGNLREPSIGAERARIIVVTKCPVNLTKKEQDEIRKKLKLKNHQKLYFSYIEYAENIYNENEEISLSALLEEKITLVTGIANPSPLCQHLDKLKIDFTHIKFPDHHNFSSLDLKKFTSASRILTTEKDYMRLKNLLSHPGLYYLPIKMKFISNAEGFKKELSHYVLTEK
ncbi:tetraacyldisaccharide 4'-kinase [Gillisia limnaea]|uniref:Tetraacyldisaccharide 4'-kinase n=1 Tax=Gillisia limnaea (strain DSM 15749 / LMG 21470 / R-8282) TaxID=865937 RepID=H2BZK6_GILLR|nr:tetraacyldisaccharide 4'-kinase [Gillisia limnaea]EHQ03415.1 lipid-A-disaccharide kinase [Gillisia limnaea DSM 15749]